MSSEVILLDIGDDNPTQFYADYFTSHVLKSRH